MTPWFRFSVAVSLLAALAGCSGTERAQSGAADAASVSETTRGANPAEAAYPGRVIHVLVALCDNVHQGIVPVPARLGNGDDPQGNLYWGAAYGVKSFLSKGPEWKLISAMRNPKVAVLERCVFKRRDRGVYLIADAYRGAEIKRSITDFFDYASGGNFELAQVKANAGDLTLAAGAGADLIVFVGHNGLMDFDLPAYPTQRDTRRRDAMILCCASKNYFARPLRPSGANPVLWTTGLMAPEAYVLKAAVEGWVRSEGGEQIRSRAAGAYHTYQRCGLTAARNLFTTGW